MFKGGGLADGDSNHATATCTVSGSRVTAVTLNSGGTYAARLGSTGTSTIRSTQIYGGGSHIATFDGVNYRLGIKETTPEKLHDKKPGEVLKLAVKRMLPGGVLGRKQLTKLKIYAGSNHPHTAQNPKVIELNKLNSKNVIRN